MSPKFNLHSKNNRIFSRTKFKKGNARTPPFARFFGHVPATQPHTHARRQPACAHVAARINGRVSRPVRGHRPGELEATVASPQPARRAQPGAEAGEHTVYAMLEQKTGRFFFPRWLDLISIRMRGAAFSPAISPVQFRVNFTFSHEL